MVEIESGKLSEIFSLIRWILGNEMIVHVWHALWVNGCGVGWGKNKYIGQHGFCDTQHIMGECVVTKWEIS